MYMYGSNWNNRVDTEEGAKKFEDLYEMSHYKMMVEYEVFHITRVFPKQYQHIAFVESDGDVNCVYTLKENEHLMVYSDGCMGDDAVFNTDGIAFVSLIRDCKQVAMWSVDQSPYDYTEEEYDLHCTEKEIFLKNIEKAVIESIDGDETCKFDPTRLLIVGQL
ncbi:hypothetical protein D3C87_79950 [compost metagenome]